MAKNYDIAYLGQAINSWLDYRCAIKKDHILDEGSIKIPASEYLDIVNVEQVKFEFTHPQLFNKSSDLRFLDTALSNDCVFEFKFLKDGNGSTTKYRENIFNDLLRLHLHHLNGKRAFFLICGTMFQFGPGFKNSALRNPTNFINVKNAAGNVPIIHFYPEWFSFRRGGTKNIVPNVNNADYGIYYQHGLTVNTTPYATRNQGQVLALPAIISTKLVFLSSGSYDSNSPVRSQLAIWEIT